jgi:gluconate 2-dehydrogenase gamma chain
MVRRETKPYRNEKKLVSAPQITSYHLSRRKLIKALLAMGVVSQLPLVYSCAGEKRKPSKSLFDKQQSAMMHSIQQILFPDDGFGPGASEIQAYEYLLWVLSDPRMDDQDRAYIYDGIRWVEETAHEEMSASYLDLNSQKQSDLIRYISQLDWGESWLSTIMTYILEALLADPQYGGNTEGVGWQWLSHYPGYPRPNKDLLYGEILDTVRKQYQAHT